MIREAIQDDLGRLVEMGEAFFAYSAFAPFVAYDPEQAAAVLSGLIDSPDAVVLVAELDGEVAGALVGALSSAWFNPTKRMAVELAWWLDPKHRHGTVGVRLMRRFEQWAQSRFADVLVMSDLVIDGSEPLGDLMTRAGYTYVERSHMKRGE